jgi:hypothetical protein
MSHARATDWPEAIRQSGKFFEPVLHHLAHVCSRTQCPRRAREIRLMHANVNRNKTPSLKKAVEDEGREALKFHELPERSQGAR